MQFHNMIPVLFFFPGMLCASSRESKISRTCVSQIPNLQIVPKLPRSSSTLNHPNPPLVINPKLEPYRPSSTRSDATPDPPTRFLHSDLSLSFLPQRFG
jgi:hypothetical protein